MNTARQFLDCLTAAAPAAAQAAAPAAAPAAASLPGVNKIPSLFATHGFGQTYVVEDAPSREVLAYLRRMAGTSGEAAAASADDAAVCDEQCFRARIVFASVKVDGTCVLLAYDIDSGDFCAAARREVRANAAAPSGWVQFSTGNMEDERCPVDMRHRIGFVPAVYRVRGTTYDVRWSKRGHCRDGSLDILARAICREPLPQDASSDFIPEIFADSRASVLTTAELIGPKVACAARNPYHLTEPRVVMHGAERVSLDELIPRGQLFSVDAWRTVLLAKRWEGVVICCQSPEPDARAQFFKINQNHIREGNSWDSRCRAHAAVYFASVN